MVLSERDFVDELASADASTLRPPPRPSPTPRRPWLLSALRIAAAASFLVFAVVLLLDSPPAVAPQREPRIAWPDRLSAIEPARESPPRPAARSCVTTAPARFVAPRALVNPGLDIDATATGFVVAFASATDETSAVRLEGSTLRAAEHVRLRSRAAAPIRRAVARDVIPIEDVEPTPRIEVAGTYVVARAPGRTHSLWTLPLPPKDPRVDAVRVAPTDDGGAVVAVKRGAALYLGRVNAAHVATGPLQIITRPNVTLGTPFVVANGGGAAIAWAERANGARDWTIVVASMGGGEMETKAVGAGISPALAVFPDGTLAVAYADGPASAHRIVVRRLAADLVPMGDLVVASPEGINAGQPVLEIRPDGRALVAWLAVARGEAPAVYATPLACDVSTSM